MALTRACGAMCSFCYAMVQEPQERASIKIKEALDFAERIKITNDQRTEEKIKTLIDIPISISVGSLEYLASLGRVETALEEHLS